MILVKVICYVNVENQFSHIYKAYNVHKDQDHIYLAYKYINIYQLMAFRLLSDYI